MLELEFLNTEPKKMILKSDILQILNRYCLHRDRCRYRMIYINSINRREKTIRISTFNSNIIKMSFSQFYGVVKYLNSIGLYNDSNIGLYCKALNSIHTFLKDQYTKEALKSIEKKLHFSYKKMRMVDGLLLLLQHAR